MKFNVSLVLCLPTPFYLHRQVAMAEKGAISKQDPGNASNFNVRPPYSQKVSTSTLKEVMRQVLEKELSNAIYQSDHASTLTKKMADDIRSRLRDLSFPRYKYMVQVVLGEQRGEGVRCGCRCFWDSEVDRQASETFMNESIFCIATTYAIYLY